MRTFLPVPSFKLWDTTSSEQSESDTANDQIVADSGSPIDKPPLALTSSPFFPINGRDNFSQPSETKKKQKTGEKTWVVDDLNISNRDESALPESTPSKSKKAKQPMKAKSNGGQETPSSSGKRKRRKLRGVEDSETTSKKQKKEKKTRLNMVINSPVFPSPPQKSKPDKKLTKPVITHSSPRTSSKSPRVLSAEKIVDSSVEEEQVLTDYELEDESAEEEAEEVTHEVKASKSASVTVSPSKLPGKGRYTNNEDNIVKETAQSYLKVFSTQ
jgi:hypothetical protein